MGLAEFRKRDERRFEMLRYFSYENDYRFRVILVVSRNILDKNLSPRFWISRAKHSTPGDLHSGGLHIIVLHSEPPSGSLHYEGLHSEPPILDLASQTFSIWGSALWGSTHYWSTL